MFCFGGAGNPQENVFCSSLRLANKTHPPTSMADSIGKALLPPWMGDIDAELSRKLQSKVSWFFKDSIRKVDF